MVPDFDGTWAFTRTVTVPNLAPGTAYAYELVRHRADGSTTALCSGRFRTEPVGGNEVRLAFGSCHGPQGAADRLGRWWAVAQYRPDLLLLLGDQVYADSVRPQGSEPWMDAYVRRYRWQWRTREMRQVLASQSTLMMLDDHDVVDGWGTSLSARTDYPRVEGALKAFHAFAGDRNPDPPVRANWATTAVDYPFSWDFVHGYMLDCRTQRGNDPAWPVLGSDQVARFERWARDVADTTDVMIVAIPVPLAYIDSDQAHDLLTNPPLGVGVGVGGVLAVGTLALGGPPGWVAGDLLLKARHLPGYDLFHYGLGGPYRAELMHPRSEFPIIDARNFGTVKVTRLKPGSRAYGIRVGLWGLRKSLTLDLHYDLDRTLEPVVTFTSP